TTDPIASSSTTSGPRSMRSPAISACCQNRRANRNRPRMTAKIPENLLNARWLASLPEAERNQLVDEFSGAEALEYKYGWQNAWARDEQLPPPGDWRVWLLLAGRGFGKTRTGAEFVRASVVSGVARRIALVAPTALDARSVMVEGESGLLS